METSNAKFLRNIFKRILKKCHIQMTSSAPGYPCITHEIIGYDDAYDLLITDSRRIFTQQWNDAEIGLYRDRMEIRQDDREWIIEPLAEKVDIFEILELS